MQKMFYLINTVLHSPRLHTHINMKREKNQSYFHTTQKVAISSLPIEYDTLYRFALRKSLLWPVLIDFQGGR